MDMYALSEPTTFPNEHTTYGFRAEVKEKIGVTNQDPVEKSHNFYCIHLLGICCLKDRSTDVTESLTTNMKRAHQLVTEEKEA